MTNTRLSPRHYFIFAGESSGDLHGGALLRALKERDPSVKLSGVGGPIMRQYGIECVLPMEAFQVMGFVDVIASFPKLRRQFYQVRDAILNSQPDVVVLIDYPGFNLRLAKALRKKNYQGKIVQLVSPTVWAWRKGRIKTMANTLDLLLTIYPFEADYFSQTPLAVKYIGHPLIETIQAHRYRDEWKKDIGIPESAPLIAIFPGSRQGEIAHNLPIQLEAAALLKKAYPDTYFAISCVNETQRSAIQTLLQKSSLSRDTYIVPRTFAYELMRDSRSAIAKSGTVTLELALHQRPTVVTYQMPLFNRLMAKYVLRLNLPHYCIVNIINNHPVFPEWIAKPASPSDIFHDLVSIHSKGNTRTECLHQCLLVRQRLGSFDTSTLAAKHIEDLFLS